MPHNLAEKPAGAITDEEDDRSILLTVIGSLSDKGIAAIMSALDAVDSAPELDQHLREHEEEDDGLCVLGCGQAVDHEPRECPAFRAEVAAMEREKQARVHEAMLADCDVIATAVVAKVVSASTPEKTALMTPEEVLPHLGIETIDALYKHVQRGNVPGVRYVGGLLRFHREKFFEGVEKLPKRPKKATR